MTMQMSEISDTSLLRDYVTTRDEDAFAELVRRRLPMVYSAAARRLGHDPSAAEDVTQAVFVQFAQGGGDLIRHPVLAGWLYVTAARKAADHSRQLVRRQRRENMHADAPTPESSDPDWSESKPLLDDAMLELEGDDRHALILRFFEGRDFAAVGRDLGVSADAARMRVTRGLEKLRALLRKRGISSSAVALEALLLRETVEAMPGPGEYGIAMRDLKSSLESYWRARGFTQPEPTHLPADLVQILLVGPFHQNRPAYDRMLRAMRGIDPAFRAPQP